MTFIIVVDGEAVHQVQHDKGQKKRYRLTLRHDGLHVDLVCPPGQPIPAVAFVPMDWYDVILIDLKPPRLQIIHKTFGHQDYAIDGSPHFLDDPASSNEDAVRDWVKMANRHLQTVHAKDQPKPQALPLSASGNAVFDQHCRPPPSFHQYLHLMPRLAPLFPDHHQAIGPDAGVMQTGFGGPIDFSVSEASVSGQPVAQSSAAFDCFSSPFTATLAVEDRKAQY